MFFITGSGTIATLAVAFTAYLGQLVPLTPLSGRLASVAMLAVVSRERAGHRPSAGFQGWTTLIKVAGIVLMSAYFCSGATGSAQRSSARPGIGRVAPGRLRTGDDRDALGLRGLAVRHLLRG